MKCYDSLSTISLFLIFDNYMQYILGSPKGICHSHTTAWNWGGYSNYFIKEHSTMVTTTCFSHVGGFFTGINACRTHSSYYHVR